MWGHTWMCAVCGGSVLYNTVLECVCGDIKEPYISAGAPQGLLLPADLHTGRRVIKQASLEIHHCRRAKAILLPPSIPPTSSSSHSPLRFFLSFSSSLFLFLSPALLNVLQCIWFKQSTYERTSCRSSVPAKMLHRQFDISVCSQSPEPAPASELAN